MLNLHAVAAAAPFHTTATPGTARHEKGSDERTERIEESAGETCAHMQVYVDPAGEGAHGSDKCPASECSDLGQEEGGDEEKWRGNPEHDAEHNGQPDEERSEGAGESELGAESQVLGPAFHDL